MPLEHSSSKAALRQNMKTLHEDIGKSVHVKSRAQAIAIALNTQREAKKKGRKRGGRTHFQIGGFANPAAAPISGPSAGAPMPAAGLSAPMPAPPMPVPAPASYTPPPAQTAAPTPSPAPSFGGAGMAGAGMMNMAGMAGMQQPYGVPSFGAGIGGFAPSAFPGAGTGMMGGNAVASKNGGGIQGLAIGGSPSPPWFVRNEARNLTHVGPVNSIVPGRTDRHGINVPSSAYVLPADHVSSLGQGNTHAGYAILNHMFHGGPYGAGAPKMGHGAGLPKPPKAMGIPSDRGGARGSQVGQPTPVVVAGGEYIIDPATVASIGNGSIKHGHAILDAWVKSNREKHIRTLKKLPGPAKS